MRIYAIAKNTQKEAISQPVVILIISLISVGVFLSQFITFFSLGAEDGMLRDTCLASVTIGGLLIAIFASASVISDEIEKKTVMTVLCKPVARHEFIIGKYIGILLTLVISYGIFSTVFCFTIWCSESPTVQGLFTLWWRNAPITQGHLAGWLGEDTQHPEQIASGMAVIGSLAGSAWLFTQKLVPDFLKALLMSFAEVSILAGAAVAASTRLPTVLNAVVSATFFVVGHIQGYLLMAFYPLDGLGRRMTAEVDKMSMFAVFLKHPTLGVAKVFHAILPDLESFNYSSRIAFDLPTFKDITTGGVQVFDSAIPIGLLCQTLLYAALYSGILVLLAIISFRNREVT